MGRMPSCDVPPRCRKQLALRPRAEPLESRRLLATLTVSGNSDSDVRDAELTLREAILVANGTLPVADLSAPESQRRTVTDFGSNTSVRRIWRILSMLGPPSPR